MVTLVFLGDIIIPDIQRLKAIPVVLVVGPCSDVR